MDSEAEASLVDLIHNGTSLLRRKKQRVWCVPHSKCLSGFVIAKIVSSFTSRFEH